MNGMCTVPVGRRLTTIAEQPVGDERELCRIREEYVEMPGLCPTQCQAQRLWGLPCDRCETLLTALIDERFLVRTTDGRFIRCGGDSRLGGPE